MNVVTDVTDAELSQLTALLARGGEGHARAQLGALLLAGCLRPRALSELEVAAVVVDISG